MDDLLAQKDQNVYNFMLQLVQEKQGDSVDANFLSQEADRLYLEFANNLVLSIEPMLSDQHKQEFAQLAQSNPSQDQLMGYLVSNIPDLEMKIIQVLSNFRANYLGVAPAAPAAVQEAQ